MMLTIAGVAASAALFNAILPAIGRSTSAIVRASASVDDRLKSDVEIVHAVGELDSAGAFADTNSNNRFEVFIWAKNTGSTRVLSITSTDIFVGQPGNFVRIPHEVELEAGEYPRWSHSLESGASEWGPKVTLKITVDYDTDTQAAGNYDIKIVLPNSVSDEHFFSM